MTTIRETVTFRTWLDGLRDREGRVRIEARITRLALGLSGDAKAVGGGVWELRTQFGPGYRIYFTRRGPVMVILLCGGDQSSQARDIEKAKALAAAMED